MRGPDQAKPGHTDPELERRGKCDGDQTLEISNMEG